MKVIVDRGKCLANGNCVLAAPNVFAQDDDGLVVVLVAEPPADEQARINEAVQQCPVQAISIA